MARARDDERPADREAEARFEFMLMLSHELRAPLAIVKEGVSLVLDRIVGKINGQQQQMLRLAKRNVDRLDGIIVHMLDMSKIEAGRMELKRSRVDLGRLARHAVQAHDEAARAKKLAVRATAPSEKIEVEADKERIAQVLLQLVGNAVKFTPEGGSVEVRVAPAAGGAAVTVEDSGVGIAEEDLPKVFEKFQQIAWAPGGGEKGVGLGLAVAKGIVELHGGTIRASSAGTGKGARFELRLPGPERTAWPKKRS